MDKSKLKFQKNKSGCWEWAGYVGKHGYGQVTIKGKSFKAHRLSYLLHKGELTSGLEIDHLCRNRKCINPQHLEEVTKKENQRRGLSVSGKNFRKKECANGHLFSEMNTYIRPDGGRSCKICRRRAYNKMYSKRRLEILTRQRKRLEKE